MCEGFYRKSPFIETAADQVSNGEVANQFYGPVA